MLPRRSALRIENGLRPRERQIKETAKSQIVANVAHAEAEAEDPPASSPPRAQASNGKGKVSRETEEPWWLDFKHVYPERAGDQGWCKAHRAANARLAEGHTPEQFIEGAKRYATFIDTTGKRGTEYVKQAASFLGPDKAFLESWTPPATKIQKPPDELSAGEIARKRGLPFAN